MQSENFDQKIKDSLSQPPPGYDNPEWDRMEKLLDKHMPQKKDDRRRLLLFLLIFLVASGGAFIIWQTAGGNKKEIVSSNSPNQIKETPDQQKQNAGSNKPDVVNGEKNKELAAPDKPVNQTADQSSQLNKDERKNTIDQSSSETEITVTGPSITKTSKKKDNSLVAKDFAAKKKATANPDKDAVTEKKTELTDDNKQESNNRVAFEKNEPVKEAEKQKAAEENKVAEQKHETKEQQPPVSAKARSEKQKTKKSFLNNLFFTLSAGPDVSTIKLHNVGKIESTYGAGLGYQISNRFSIRVGYYKGRKVYSAYPKDYDPPPNFWSYYPNMKNIDADCKVTELPISADYTFNKKKKESWFVSAGISSLFMKKEVYDFYYKPNYSPNYLTYSRTINNQNKHYFSILNLSGGYTRTINKNFSIQAEPYLKIAMTGIGYGKVKLNSGGVLFSAIIKPFAKK